MSMDKRNMILVIAVLIATTTFQALLQPPGGVMRDNNTTHIYINRTITTANFISTNITHFNATIFTNNTDTTDNPTEIKGPSDEYKEVQKYKADIRKQLIEQGYHIWGIVGDQWSSIEGLPTAKRTFKLPNPMYYVS
ncbi:uncharacterized protein LOC114276467 [Camellia sinensis]|uniref:uncharacterized protein LOC114276467 n=1 Tax=Camellia sinensis TaxID=4442 RepID=UPI0010357DA8|nr:uncharacterized protein LOC114276467 [Camellia sinensis]